MAKKPHKKESPIEAFEDTIQQETAELRKEYKHFERFRDENSLLMGVFVIGLVILVIINTLFWVQFTRNRYAQQNKMNATVASLSASTSLQTAHNFAVSARVSDVGESNREDKAFALTDDEKLLTMQFSITNRTKTNQQFIPIQQLYIRTSQGGFYLLKPSSFVANPVEFQTVEPGQTAKGTLSFAIPKNSSTPLLYVDTQWDNSTPLVIDVLH